MNTRRRRGRWEPIHREGGSGTVDLYAQKRVLPKRYDVGPAFDRSFNVL